MTAAARSARDHVAPGWLTRRRATALGLLAGAGIDAVVADPRRGHPVAGFGRLATGLERLAYRDHEVAGAAYLALLVGGTTVAIAQIDRRLAPGGHLLLTALAVATALGGTSLRRTASALADDLDADDLDAARDRLPWLCGRDPADLDAAGLTRAALESVAENTSDAVVATLLWGAVGGPAGVVAHRAANTLDAMVGYRTTRYRRFGAPAARVDDLSNLVPARVTAGLLIALAPTVGGRPAAAWRVWRRDAGGHPSPNAGPVEAAAAGALGVTLAGTVNRYGDQVDRRPALGDGPAPTATDLRRAVALTGRVSAAALALAVAVALAPRATDPRATDPRATDRGRP